MKNYLLGCLCTCAFNMLVAQNTDLPNPNSNLQTLPAGSYVIAMDNTLQVNSSGDFNLKAYGLIVYLLNNNIPIKWSIKAGKAKDGTDFTGTAEQVKPTLVSGGVSRDFKAGPFVISKADTSGVAALIDAFYTANSLTGNNRPQVYRLTADATNVDIRYNLTDFRPKAAILTDGGNQNIHIAYFTAAGIPTASYSTSTGVNLIANCYTFASEPHNTNTGIAVNNAIIAIKDFVLNGGNFLAQCEAIDNYENNLLGRFQTTGGITISNANIGTTLTYSNPDLSFSQYEGSYNGSQGGGVKNWKIVGSLANNEHDHATGTGVNTSSIGASVSKHYSGKGGLVFYVGNHSFSSTTLVGINGIRMYMNAFLTPSNTNCPSAVNLDLRLINFSASTKKRKTTLSWTVDENETAEKFKVERSIDGVNFTACGSVAGNDKSGNQNYDFSEKQFASKVYYRLKLISKTGRSYNSNILVIEDEKTTNDYLTIFTNPTKGDLSFSYHSDEKKTVDVNIYNSLGRSVYSSKLNCFEGDNVVKISGDYLENKGCYLLNITDDLNKRIGWTIMKL